MALLAVLTLAAEAMGENEAHKANGYYPRLFEVLDVSKAGEQAHLISGYRRDAEQLWQALNDWLSAEDGRFGLPTAYALTHRYIGLPMS